MKQIAPNVLYLERADWGADPAYPRLGDPLIDRASRTHLITHHTVTVDADSTKNVWENAAEVKRHMQRLQVIRPDLGLDVPYNFVLFPMADGSIIVCEGRGFDRWGAHTSGGFDRDGTPTMDQAAIRAGGQWHNGTGLATSVAGNHEDFGPDFGPYVQPYGVWLTYVVALCPNVLTMRPARAVSWGHRDFFQTACPGRYVYDVLPLVQIGSAPAELEDDMVIGHYAKSIPWTTSYVVTVGKEGARKTAVNGAAEYESMIAAGFPVKVMDEAKLRKIVSTSGTPEP